MDTVATRAHAASPPTRPEGGSRLIVIDRDSGFETMLRHHLERLGWWHHISGAEVALDDLIALRAEVVLIDPAALGAAGPSYVDRLCASLPELGVVVCTAGSSVAERVRALQLGVDDWIAKPCHPVEALARVAAVQRRRRAGSIARPAALVAGELEIRPQQFQAVVGERSLDLTRREYELLALLARAPDQVLEREEIYQRVWGYAMARGDRSVDVFIRKLRQKLGRASPQWNYIHTHFGIGYRFSPERA